MNKEEQLKSDHLIQKNWIENQINKPRINGESSFFNTKTAQRAYEKMGGDSLIISDSEIEHFVSVHLNKVGKKRLITALRVYQHRDNSDSRDSSKRLQTEITGENHLKLVRIASVSGQSKKDIINQIIEGASIESFRK